RRRVRGDPVDAADDLRVGPAALRVYHLDGVELRPRRDADDAGAVVLRADRPCDVGAVTVVILRVSAADAVLAVHGVEVAMREIDPGVDDRDVRGRGLAHRGGRGGTDAAHTRWRAVTCRDRDR